LDISDYFVYSFWHTLSSKALFYVAQKYSIQFDLLNETNQYYMIYKINANKFSDYMKDVIYDSYSTTKVHEFGLVSMNHVISTIKHPVMTIEYFNEIKRKYRQEDK